MTKTMTYWTTKGSVRGSCGHKHKTREAAERCSAKDHRNCKRGGAGCYSDRSVIEVTRDTEADDDGLIGIDITLDGHDPRILCTDCGTDRDGQPVYTGEEWGTDTQVVRCDRCGSEIAGLVIVPRHV